MSKKEGALLGVTINGNVYALKGTDCKWRQQENEVNQIHGFKRVSACPTSTWALGCDHQLYLWVSKTDVPIRVQDCAYENERWIPGRGWQKENLLPLDPYAWSSCDGQVSTPKDSFKLPSRCWNWDSDWYIDETVDGFVTDKGGWRYSAIDFRKGFTHVKRFNSCVRRRKWIRHRTFIALNGWSRVVGFHHDPLEEPFVSVSVGGSAIPDQLPGFATVWAVTINGCVLYRTVHSICPEGKCWLKVKLDEGHEVLSLSTSALGATWAVTWTGQLIFRSGVTWQEPMGDGWEHVDIPSDANRLAQVVVGTRAVWLLSNSGECWFRKGLRQDMPCGTGWLLQSVKLKSITLGLDDKLFGVGYEDRVMFVRLGVTVDEPCGRYWQAIDLPYSTLDTDHALRTQNSKASSLTDLVIGNSSYKMDSRSESLPCEATLPELPPNSASVPCLHVEDVDARMDGDSAVDDSTTSSHDTSSCEFPKPDAKFFLLNKGLMLRNTVKQKVSTTVPFKLIRTSIEKGKITIEKNKEIINKIKTRVDTQRHRFLHGPGEVKLNVRYDGDDVDTVSVDSIDDPEEFTSLHPDSESDPQLDLCSLDSTDGVMEPDEGPLQWVWLSAGACAVTETSIRQWMAHADAGNVSDTNMAECGHWRSELLTRIRSRNDSVMPFLHYEVAVEQTCWSKKTRVKLWCDDTRHCRFVDSDLELTQDELDVNATCFSYTYNIHDNQKGVIRSAADLLCVCCLPDDSPKASQTVCVYTAERMRDATPRGPLMFLFNSEKEAEEWVGALNAAICRHRRLRGGVRGSAMWACTERGDVFVNQFMSSESHTTSGYWRLFGGHMRAVETSSSGVTWGLGQDGNAWAYSGGCGGGFYKDLPSAAIHTQADHMVMSTYENQRWSPVTGYSDRGLLMDRFAWSDEKGEHERLKDSVKLPSRHWTWVSDWVVDRSVAGGVDSEGWQYARHFGRPFLGRKRLRSYVRRRRWIRQCMLSTPGPWIKVDDNLLRDVAVVTFHNVTSVWAVASSGDVLVRCDVTSDYPTGTSWSHVTTDQPYIAVSACATPLAVNVWCLGADGSVWRRSHVSSSNIKGTCWCHIAPPRLRGVKFTRLAAGITVLYAIDSKDELWLREGITAANPEGNNWSVVARDVRQISLSPQDQAWGINDGNKVKCGPCQGAMACLQDSNTKNNKWNLHIAGGWRYVTARGLSCVMESGGNLDTDTVRTAQSPNYL